MWGQGGGLATESANQRSKWRLGDGRALAAHLGGGRAPPRRSPGGGRMLVPLKWLAALISAIASLFGPGTKSAPAPVATLPAPPLSVYRTAGAATQPGLHYQMRFPLPPSGRALELSSRDEA